MTHRAIQSLRVFKTVTKSHDIHPQRRWLGALLRLSFIKYDSSSQNPSSANRAPSPTLPLQNDPERGGICTLALPSPPGVSMEAGAGLVELRARPCLYSPTLATATANAPRGWK